MDTLHIHTYTAEYAHRRMRRAKQSSDEEVARAREEAARAREEAESAKADADAARREAEAAREAAEKASADAAQAAEEVEREKRASIDAATMAAYHEFLAGVQHTWRLHQARLHAAFQVPFSPGNRQDEGR